MNAALSALRAFRLRGGGRPCDARPPASVLFVLCAEAVAATRFAAAVEPAMVLQNLGGAVPAVRKGGSPGEGAAAGDEATIQYAFAVERVRHVVLCGHTGCRWTAPDALKEVGERLVDPRFPREKLASQASLLLGEGRVRAHAAALDRSVAVHALWFDRDEGDVYLYRPAERRFALLDDLDAERLLGELGAEGRP